MLIHNQQKTQSAVSGTFQYNTDNMEGLIRQIVVNPHTDSTQYDIKIVNPSGVIIYERLSETGTMSELTEMPVKGVYTVTVSNSTRDEAFIISLMLNE